MRDSLGDALGHTGITLPTESELHEAGDTLAQVLEDAFARHDADHWTTLLSNAGVGCVRADGPAPSSFWLLDEQVKALDLTAEVDHARWGRHRRHGPMVLFDAKPPALGPAPLAGQENVELLTLLGYSSEQITTLQADGVIWQES